MSVAVESAREEWAEAYRRLADEAGDRVRYERLLEQVEAVTAELRKRIGQTFTLAELVVAYDEAERWVRDVVAATAPPPGWPRTLALVEGAAFHQYARGALDYVP